MTNNPTRVTADVRSVGRQLVCWHEWSPWVSIGLAALNDADLVERDCVACGLDEITDVDAVSAVPRSLPVLGELHGLVLS